MYSIDAAFHPIQAHRRMRLHSRTIGWASLAVMIPAASTYAAFAKVLTGVFSPLSMLFLSESMLLIFAILSFGLLPLLHSLFRLKRSLLPQLLLLGTLNGALAPLLLFIGLQHTTAINTELFGRTETIFIMLLGANVLHQRIDRPHIVGGAVILLGILTATLEGFSNGITLHSGDVFILLSALTFSIGGTVVRKSLLRVDPALLIIARSGMALCVFFLVSPFIAHPFIDEVRLFPLTLLPALIGFGFIARFVAVFTCYQAIERLPVHTYALMATTTVAGSIFFSHLYLGEPLHWYHGVGTLCIILGAGLVHMKGLYASEQHFRTHIHAQHQQRV
ncbi:hypothetical protein COU80_00300 [Candidatus Peregrinibacteria bacterium CG10_big_fil_rev_8_21_14_0_10_55_24]|nr:MAG: hypothetical protein COU80_00300 [Candidatus Peregrinibacteria bacterium CG10_big_fil_rev_8_21_14_0_10_55_24]